MPPGSRLGRNPSRLPGKLHPRKAPRKPVSHWLDLQPHCSMCRRAGQRFFRLIAPHPGKRPSLFWACFPPEYLNGGNNSCRLLARTADSSSTAGHNQPVSVCLTARLILSDIRREQTSRGAHQAPTGQASSHRRHHLIRPSVWEISCVSTRDGYISDINPSSTVIPEASRS